MTYIVKMNGKQYEVEVERHSPFHMLTREEIEAGGSAALDSKAAPDSAAKPAPVKEETKETEKKDNAPAASTGNPGEILCPMYGTILSVNVQAGSKVSAGDVVFMIEAMKMETEIVAPVDGEITEIKVEAGQSVEADQVLAVIG